MLNELLRQPRSVRERRCRRAAARSTSTSSSRASSCRSTARTWRWSATRLFADRPLDEFLTSSRRTSPRSNRAIANIPRDRVRLHACWGNYEAPHHLDVPLERVLPLLYQANVGALVLPLANPQHAHEWRCFERYPLPDDMLLVAGVIDTTTNFVEHPEAVADRIERVAQAVGDPTRVLAGTDCGFDTSAGLGERGGRGGVGEAALAARRALTSRASDWGLAR